MPLASVPLLATPAPFSHHTLVEEVAESCMDDDRIERAWLRCRRWISFYEGIPTEAYFVGAPQERMITAVERTRASSTSFSFAPVWTADERASPTSAQEMVRLLARDEAADCCVSYVTTRPGFELRIDLMVDLWPDGTLDGDAVWWGDLVFVEGVNIRDRFRDLLSYFLDLAEEFGCRRLMLGQGSYANPRSPGPPWFEV